MPKPSMPAKRQLKQPHIHLFACGIIILINLVLYGNTLSPEFEFVYDDTHLIVENPLIQDMGNLKQILHDGRPLRTVTFMIDYAVWGLNPVGFHLWNVIWHILACLMLYAWLVRLQTMGIWQTRETSSFLFALIVVLLFAAHPVHTEAVAGIANRKEMLVTVFFLAAFYAYLPNRLGWDMLSTVAFVFALLSKEVAITLPLVLIGFDCCFRIQTWREIKPYVPRYIMYFMVAGFAFANYISARPIYIGITFLVALTLPVIVRWVSARSTATSVLFKTGAALSCLFLLIPLIKYAPHLPQISKNLTERFLYLFSAEQTRGLTYDRVLFTTIRSFWHNLQLLIFPANLSADQYLIPSESWYEPAVLFSLGLIILVLSVMIWSFRRSRLITFALGFYLINLLPVSNLIPAAYFVAERYLYLPSVGFCLLVGYGLWAWLINKRFRPLGIGVLALLIGLYGFKTIDRNGDWKSNYTLWSAALKVDPNNPHAHFYLGNVYRERGDLAQAAHHYEQSLKLEPNQIRTLTNLGNIYFYQQDFETAIQYYERAVKLDWGKSGLNREYVYNNLGTAYFYRQEFEKAITYLEKAVEIRSDKPDIRCNLGQAYARTGQNEKARFEYQTALQLAPNYPEPYKYLGLLTYQEGDFAAAIQYWERYLQLAPASPSRGRIAQFLNQARRKLSP
ncbi:MAG: tetratricopeptide repeat protein [Gemmatimonadetes bacterium]|nr:MAG: tetratricopeptide repeat protein [Gemmatimonadota bacterium]